MIRDVQINSPSVKQISQKEEVWGFLHLSLQIRSVRNTIRTLKQTQKTHGEGINQFFPYTDLLLHICFNFCNYEGLYAPKTGRD
jgi:hypothetical protein